MSTIPFVPVNAGDDVIKRTLNEVYLALEEKNYNPVNQIVGYLISGDPTYITSHKNARNALRKFERDEILSFLLRQFVENTKKNQELGEENQNE